MFFLFCYFFENNQIFIFEINETITAEIYMYAFYNMHPREPLYSNNAGITCWLQSTSAQNCVIFLSFFTSENIYCALLSLIEAAVYLHNKLFVG